MKKVLPPILFLLFALSMGFVCWGLQQIHNILYPYNLWGMPPVIIGLGIAAWHNRLFHKLGTNIMTFDEPDLLVQEYGLFKYTRNPMYLGFVIALFGIAILYQGSISSFLMALLFMLITDRWYIKFEEQAMHEKFGIEYERYCSKVRRWI